MGLFDSIKRLVGMGENRPAETEGSDVTVHVSDSVRSFWRT